MNDNFKFSGFPENESFEIQDENKNKEKRSEFQSEMNEMLKNFQKMSGQNNLPFEGIQDIFKSLGIEESDITNIINKPDALLGFISGLFGADMDDADEDEYDEEESEEKFVYELSDINYLGKQLLGSVPATNIGSQKLLNDFESIFGKNGKEYPSKIESLLLKGAYINETGYNALLYFKDNFGKILIKETTDFYLLAYIEPKDTNKYGMYFVFSEDENQDPCISVPIFGNTFNVDSDGNFIGAFDKTVETPMFDGDKFIPESRGFLDMSLMSQLVILKNILISPSQFGEIKNVRPVIKEDSELLEIGKIVSNESTEAILLKRDADLDLNETEFPFYLDFGHVISKESLQILSSILFKIDLNETLLMQASELEFKRGMLYIKVNFGKYFS